MAYGVDIHEQNDRRALSAVVSSPPAKADRANGDLLLRDDRRDFDRLAGIGRRPPNEAT
ncbi:hypothetical protein J2X06_002804 [Lysobacter niastensis]|uniref:Transposase n=1 Tax=Lysobacter niastensis TaxID=380629 RepID=A0ABU1WE12_9GAMM|nr:hypothetical protein [Lysobacter niastensis]